jgi:hypothetical protein
LRNCLKSEVDFLLTSIAIVRGLLLFGVAGLTLESVTLAITARLMKEGQQHMKPAAQPVGETNAVARLDNEGSALAHPTKAQP